jgi:hypothetical protein
MIGGRIGDEQQESQEKLDKTAAIKQVKSQETK